MTIRHYFTIGLDVSFESSAHLTGERLKAIGKAIRDALEADPKIGGAVQRIVEETLPPDIEAGDVFACFPDNPFEHDCSPVED